MNPETFAWFVIACSPFGFLVLFSPPLSERAAKAITATKRLPPGKKKKRQKARATKRRGKPKAQKQNKPPAAPTFTIEQMLAHDRYQHGRDNKSGIWETTTSF